MSDETIWNFVMLILTIVATTGTVAAVCWARRTQLFAEKVYKEQTERADDADKKADEANERTIALQRELIELQAKEVSLSLEEREARLEDGRKRRLDDQHRLSVVNKVVRDKLKEALSQYVRRTGLAKLSYTSDAFKERLEEIGPYLRVPIMRTWHENYRRLSDEFKRGKKTGESDEIIPEERIKQYYKKQSDDIGEVVRASGFDWPGLEDEEQNKTPEENPGA